jgi:hypothetical protein
MAFATNALRLWRLNLDWAAPGSATLTGQRRSRFQRSARHVAAAPASRKPAPVNASTRSPIG